MSHKFPSYSIFKISNKNKNCHDHVNNVVWKNRDKKVNVIIFCGGDKITDSSILLKKLMFYHLLVSIQVDITIVCVCVCV